MNGNIKQLNENFDLNRRAVAYAQNNPGIPVADAVRILNDRDESAKVRRAKLTADYEAVKANRIARTGQ